MSRRGAGATAAAVVFVLAAGLLLHADRRMQVEAAASVASADAVAATEATDPVIEQLIRVRATVEDCLAAIRTATGRTFQVVQVARERLRARIAARRAAARRARERQQRRQAARRESGGLLVGDSVSLGAQSCLEPLGYELDSEVGRQFSTGLGRLEAHAADGLPDTVVVHLGTNGPFSADGFDDVMAVTGSGRRVVWVTIALPDLSRYGFADGQNDLIRSKAAEYDNVRVADWATAAAQHPDWTSDGIHLTSSGCDGFTAIVDAAVRAP